MRVASIFIVCSLALLGCSSDSTPSSLGGRLSISAPTSNEMIANPSNGLIPVTFDTNYVLKDPGTCNGQSGCGSVYLLIDGTNCNASGEAWNVNATSSPDSVNLGLCATAIGQHTISAELHTDTGAFVENSITKTPVTAAVTITIQQ
jgi:hypothetical protein